MARVTVEDCLDKVQNRFELVLLASKRARQLLTTGIDPLVPWGKDKSKDKATVVALREIASGQLNTQHLSEFEVDFEKKPTQASELFLNHTKEIDNTNNTHNIENAENSDNTDSTDETDDTLS